LERREGAMAFVATRRKKREFRWEEEDTVVEGKSWGLKR
jgi:hypothetical protein